MSQPRRPWTPAWDGTDICTTLNRLVCCGLDLRSRADLPSRRVIAPVKQNLCEPGAAVAFSLEPAGKAVRVVWTGDTAHTADGLLVSSVRAEERMAQTEAVEFLRAALAGGERPASDLLREAEVTRDRGDHLAPRPEGARGFRCGAKGSVGRVGS